MLTHYDLFAGIGGFSLALDEVFYDRQIKHIFCEWEQFPTAVLKKHWPDGEYWGDITELIAHTESKRWQGSGQEAKRHARLTNGVRQDEEQIILTGGFPCQPFSHAGRRKGTADDRYQWPNMFAVIRNVKPDWVIAENVRGLVTWNDGMVLEQVCSDLEGEGYEVQPIIVPAVAVNAPHRRDRVWIIGHAKHDGQYGSQDRQSNFEREYCNASWPGEAEQPTGSNLQGHTNADPRSEKPRGLPQQSWKADTKGRQASRPDWNRDWQEVAFATCNDAMDDGLPRNVDGVPYSRAKWRKESLKAYGNAIVPQVAMEIFKAIRSSIELAKQNLIPIEERKTDA